MLTVIDKFIYSGSGLKSSDAHCIQKRIAEYIRRGKIDISGNHRKEFSIVVTNIIRNFTERHREACGKHIMFRVVYHTLNRNTVSIAFGSDNIDKISEEIKPGRGCKVDPGYHAKTPFHEMANYLRNRYGRKVGWFLATRFAMDFRKLGKPECCNNFRTTSMINPIDVKHYNKIMESGCCGSFDGTYVFYHRFIGIPYWSTIYRIGFNYGH